MINNSEEKLIFGNLLETIANIVKLNEASTTSGNVNKANELALRAASAAKKGTIDAKQALDAKQSAENIKRDYVADQIEERRKKDAFTGEKVIKEDALENAERALDSIKRQEERVDANFEKRKESAKKRIEIIKQNKKAQSNTSETADEAQSLTESVNKDVREMLFNGKSGQVLKFLILGEINNINRTDLNIIKKLKAEDEVQFYIKNINEILKRFDKNKEKETDYSDLKKFKMLLKIRFINEKNKDIF